MKTDIFKDLVPLCNMTIKEVNELSDSIIEENKDPKDKQSLKELLYTIDYLVQNIAPKLKP